MKLSNQEIRQVLETKVMVKNPFFVNDMKRHICTSLSAESDISADNHSLHPLCNISLSSGKGNNNDDLRNPNRNDRDHLVECWAIN